MERLVQQSMPPNPPTRWALLALDRIDSRSWIACLGAVTGSFLLAKLSIEVSRFGETLATIWLPAAVAAVVLLRMSLKNEVPFLTGMWAGIAAANLIAGFALPIALVFGFANLVEVALVVSLIRRSCGPRPDMHDIEHLARFVWVAGLVAPGVSAAIATIAMAIAGADMLGMMAGWMITHALSMVLIAPAMLLVSDVAQQKPRFSKAIIIQHSWVLAVGLGSTFLVFNQQSYPLLFLVPPLTLLCAFRLGSAGTAIFTLAVAILAMVMTLMGYGPIAMVDVSAQEQMQVALAFIAANFLTGLPIAAILHGRDQMTQELAARSRELRLLTENTTDTLMYYDLTGKCTYVSPSVIEVMGEPSEIFLGKRASDRMHKDAQDRIARAETRLLTGVSEKERFTFRRFNDSQHGTPVFLEADCAIARHPETGNRQGIVVSLRDVTERVELELLLTRARRKAEHAARAKSEFLANMSHEIRTPMNGVLGFAELMLQTELDETQRKNVELIVQSGRSMMMLLNDTLDLSKIEAGQISIDRHPVDLDATIDECTALHRSTAEQKGLKLVYENQADQPWVMTDGLRVRQIVLNLVGNAVKFTERGGITVSCRISAQEIVVEVIDTGIGISQKRAKRIFDPFTQGESDTARRFGGTGLGLSISRQLAEMLGGYLEVESEVGVGSCFRLTLPFIKAKPQTQDATPVSDPTLEPLLPVYGDDATPDAAKLVGAANARLPNGSRILLAEDHDVNRILATEMLERCGQDVYIAHDGNEAIAMVLDAFLRGDPYDLVLMDVQMPGCDGYEATRAIRGEGICSNQLPIVALTANAFPEDIIAARKAGMQGHLAKPLEFAHLARALQRWLPTRIIEDHTGRSPKSTADQGSGSASEEAATVREGDEIDARVQDAMRKQHKRGTAHHQGDSGSSKDDGSASPSRRVIDFPVNGEQQPRAMHSPALIKRWEERREEALETLREGIAMGIIEGELGKRLMRQLHKLAGTAGIFGEEDLGDKASELERGLRDGVDQLSLKRMGEELLELANERGAGWKKSGTARI